MPNVSFENPAWRIVLGIAVAMLVTWLALVVALLVGRPKGALLKEALRLLPDTLRLLRRLASDPMVPRRTRIMIWFLIVYLAFPIDVIPDFIPVIGYADDAILVLLVLRAVARHAGIDALRRNWPGSEDGFAALCRLVGL